MTPKSKAVSKAKDRFTFHDLHSDSTYEAPYSQVRSSLKKSYSKKASSQVRQMAHKLKENTSEAIPAKGGYYSRIK